MIGRYPGAIMPSDTSLDMILAVATSQASDRAIKSPKDDILSAPEESVMHVFKGFITGIATNFVRNKIGFYPYSLTNNYEHLRCNADNLFIHN